MLFLKLVEFVRDFIDNFTWRRAAAVGVMGLGALIVMQARVQSSPNKLIIFATAGLLVAGIGWIFYRVESARNKPDFNELEVLAKAQEYRNRQVTGPKNEKDV